MLSSRFIIVGGKGGVGRTAVSVALALVLARQGKRVLLTHVRSKQRLGQLLGTGEISDRIRKIEENLWAVNMTPASALREKGLMVLRFRAVYRAVMENRLVRYFLRAIPALNEYAMLGKAWYHTTETQKERPRYDVVIFDGPAMGHLVTMLRIPQVITDTVPPGPLSADARRVRELLEDPSRTSLWIVALAEEMPAREAEELYHKAVNDLKIKPQWLVVNGLYPAELTTPEVAHALEQLGPRAAGGFLAPLLESAATLRSRRLINERYLQQLAQRLPLPAIELPNLFVSELDRSAIEALAQRIEAALLASGQPGQASEGKDDATAVI